MPNRLAALVPLALATLLVGCATTPAQSLPEPTALREAHTRLADLESELEDARQLALEQRQQERRVERLLDRGLQLVGTRYRYGGTSV